MKREKPSMGFTVYYISHPVHANPYVEQATLESAEFVCIDPTTGGELFPAHAPSGSKLLLRPDEMYETEEEAKAHVQYLNETQA